MTRINFRSMVVTLVVAFSLWVSGCNWQGEEHRDNLQDGLRIVFQIPVQQTGDPNTVIPKAAVDGTIAVAFSQAMDLCSFTSASFFLRTANGNPVSGFIFHRTTQSYPSGFIIFQPTANLAPDTVYTMTIKAGVRALDGTLLPADYSWRFTTAPPAPANPQTGGPAPAINRAAPLATSPVTCETPAAAIQVDGKVVSAGHINGANYMEFAVARYNAGGGLDTSFSGDGITTVIVGSGNSQALAATVQADGRIVAVGVSSNAENKDFALARYNTNGSFDTTFSDNGNHFVDLGTGDERALAVAVRPDGKIWVAGSANDGAAFILARYNTDGSTDTTFGVSGIVSTPATVSSETSYAMVLQGDGKMVVASKVLVAATQVTVTRYNTNGSVDSSFNGGVPLALPLTVQQASATLAAHADGRIVLVGHSGVGATAQFTVLGYLVY